MIDPAPALFRPITLSGLKLANRIVIAPMCQYSARDGVAQPWHLQHLGSLAVGGAGLLMTEATAVEPEGRITLGCLGLYNDETEEALARTIAGIRSFSATPIGMQISHAGRKAASHVPWEGGGPLTAAEGAWQPSAPSPLANLDGWQTPEALDEAGLERIKAAFVATARRALRIGIDLLELHGAHGYLLHTFLSPLSNQRTDRYGGSRENRLRLPLEVFDAVRALWPADKPLGVRVSATDWLDGGLTIADTIAFGHELKARGVDYVCVSSGGIGRPRIPVGEGYQVPLARQFRAETGIATRAVGMIVDADHAERIVADGDADMVAFARAVIDNPRWPWHAAARLGAKLAYPPQYERGAPALWPGFGVAHG
ncbi:NADH-dependent flavin oxidoreductase [Aliidongia dinghuensis]|uniref:NADH-dependent flavin oxidoreductase n=1 Tax=Aliidongia dinghuensis TaxID=1867774 RepID=A0A8J2YYS7_9PROT|nr:NADH:flavin oxidoreductase/NADH oxidase [Aliidongia dinghuensis]GGF40489.1 NADH-dependent flavin oxidoreductase [Aliidongia dinghuensis]